MSRIVKFSRVYEIPDEEIIDKIKKSNTLTEDEVVITSELKDKTAMEIAFNMFESEYENLDCSETYFSAKIVKP